MDAFATVKDLESRWRVMDSAEKKRAEVLLQDAAAIISSALNQSGVKIDGYDKTQNANLVRVSCAMVQRAMAQGDGEQEHAWGGNLVMNPSGDLYLSKADKRSLGIGRMRVGFASPFGGAQ